jgi:hypothetical protein
MARYSDGVLYVDEKELARLPRFGRTRDRKKGSLWKQLDISQNSWWLSQKISDKNIILSMPIFVRPPK